MIKKCKLDRSENCIYCGACDCLDDKDIEIINQKEENNYIKENNNLNEI
jgi:hypothetical protein